MLPIKTILHPTDFSAHSDYAFRLACSLSRDYDARLMLLHVATSPIVAYSEGGAPPIDRQSLVNEAWENFYHLETPTLDVQPERRVVEGDAATEIVREAGEINADLIVMGTHGRTGLNRLLMGSVAEHTLRRAPCPVLTVRMPSETEARKADLNLEPAVG